jgi:hypothetical protein
MVLSFLFAILEYNPYKKEGLKGERDRHEDIINLLSKESKEFLLSLARDEIQEEQEMEEERSRSAS